MFSFSELSKYFNVFWNNKNEKNYYVCCLCWVSCITCNCVEGFWHLFRLALSTHSYFSTTEYLWIYISQPFINLWIQQLSIVGGSLDKGHSYCLGEKCYLGNFYSSLGLTQGGYKSCLGNIFYPGNSYGPRLGNPLLLTIIKG